MQITLDDILAQIDKVEPSTPKPKSKPTTPPDPWINEALVLLIEEVTCRCGHHWTAPASSPLLRRRHRRTGTINLTSDAPIPAGLPRDIETRTREVSACPRCFHPTVGQRRLPLQ